MEESKNDVLFGTVMFGGFNRKNVMDYIEGLQKKLMECEAVEGTPQANRLEQAEADLEDARAKIRSLTEALERANAEKAELLEKLENAEPVLQPAEEVISEDSLMRDKMTEVKNSLEEVSALLEQVTQLKAQLRVEQTANELLNEKVLRQTSSEPAAEPEPVEEPESEQHSMSLDDVDMMVQKYFS